MGGRKTWAVFLAVVLTALVVVPLLRSATARKGVIATLKAGDAAFWHGPYIDQLDNAPGLKRCRGGKCFSYGIDIVERADRLRVALDFPPNQFIDLRLRNPRGKATQFIGGGEYSKEIFVTDPIPGRWRVEVYPRAVSDGSFRLRAKLESLPKRSGPRRVLLPNLRLEPPYEFTFDPPATMLGGATVNAGEGAGSCAYEEIAEDNATLCLRLSVGPQNAGRGPLELRFSPMADAATGEAPMYQRVHFTDGSKRERRAGTYEYHKTHGHYHFTGFATMNLFRVRDPRDGRLAPAGKGHKSGFCFGDVMMNSWRRFIQGLAHSSRSSCKDFEKAYMGLTAGWTDIYGWDTPGNYVDFADNPNGRYVVRATVDAANKILETDERDNTSYAYIQVTGERVRLLERGFGNDPWDPKKVVAVDWLKALRRE